MKERICVWPCGTWCWEYDVECMSFMSDDYSVTEVRDGEDIEDVVAAVNLVPR